MTFLTICMYIICLHFVLIFNILKKVISFYVFLFFTYLFYITFLKYMMFAVCYIIFNIIKESYYICLYNFIFIYILILYNIFF